MTFYEHPSKKWYESPFPALNIHRRDEPVATDSIHTDTPAVDSGSTIAQGFVGVESLVTNVYAIKTEAVHQHSGGPDLDSRSSH